MKLRSKKDSKVSIKYKVFGYFAIFIACTIAFLWFFQILFLNEFYKMTKINEIKQSAITIEKSINLENADDILKELAYKRDLCIEIVNIDSGIKVSVEADHNCIIHKLTYVTLLHYLEEAKANGGSYTEIISSSNDNGLLMFPFMRKSPESLVYAKVATINEQTVLMVLNTSISPVDATVNTIKIQLMVLSVLLVILAFILAMIMYKRISKPIMEINDSAKELAKGNYDITFNGGGYLEISELSNTLNYASHELNKVETLRQELIANISHDLRTPLTMISGYAEVMRDLPNENNSENAQIIIDEAARLTSLVNDVLDLSKLQSGTQELQIEEYDITSSISRILERFKKFTSKDGYVIEYNYDEHIYIEADELRISQVVYNLINNALTYTGDDKTIIVNQKVINDYVRIEVCDHGVGIPEEMLASIWERYYKAKNQHRRAINGSGLGLSIVKSTLEAHNEILPDVSRYGVESKINEGSVFYFEYRISKS
ncbi:MAG: HAMP domain-containing histidine kinase [Erysipelotrichales bacterium]|nr:HAMP domain-containing histidine kinase [Erysipelotrichales bacterium]